jgi:hypothetical protein
MRFLKCMGLSAALLGILFLTADSAHAAQVAVGVRVGPVGVAIGPEPFARGAIIRIIRTPARQRAIGVQTTSWAGYS